MKIAIASDHGGFALKQNVIMYLEAEGHEVSDLGCYSEESVDYPQFGRTCAQAVARHQADRGIVICGSGIGISIAANKVKGIRCALCTSVEMAKLSRQHNDANMLAMGGRLTELPDALDIVRAWLTTEFEGGRHERRVGQLNEM
ncbi:MAG: ribose 5-phosphate isomerase B [Firmicutes bacterium]|nr:ribose 5-phosphate isomerase B [Bacillota bacterium]